MKKIYWLKLLGSLILPQLFGFFGSLFTTPQIPGWYQTLQKPIFNPPSWLFAPVWTSLFLLMGVSVYFIWSEPKNSKRNILLGLFIFQLFLNLFWSILFFGLQSPILALIEIIILWFAILICVIGFWKINKISSILLWPYLAWVSFASILNYYIFILN